MSPTLMAVHAHPDDEATSTGGVLARYAAEGVRTIVVTCTNGELGDLPGGIKPGADDHDEEEVVRTRRAELESACRMLGVAHLELLGYRDSGMADWDHKQHPDAFCNVPLDEVAARLSQLLERHRPDVVITYDHESPYDHPDHIHTSLATMAAVRRTGVPRKTYMSAFRSSRFVRVRQVLQEQGVELPEPPERPESWIKKMQEQEMRITTTIDVGAYVATKVAALRVHDSQIGDSFWSRLPEAALDEFFREESFIRVQDVTGAPVPEDDLFAGIR